MWWRRSRSYEPRKPQDWASIHLNFETPVRVHHSGDRVYIESGNYAHQHTVSFLVEHGEVVAEQIIAATTRARREAALGGAA